MTGDRQSGYSAKFQGMRSSTCDMGCMSTIRRSVTVRYVCGLKPLSLQVPSSDLPSARVLTPFLLRGVSSTPPTVQSDRSWGSPYVWRLLLAQPCPLPPPSWARTLPGTVDIRNALLPLYRPRRYCLGPRRSASNSAFAPQWDRTGRSTCPGNLTKPSGAIAHRRECSGRMRRSDARVAGGREATG